MNQSSAWKWILAIIIIILVIWGLSSLGGSDSPVGEAIDLDQTTEISVSEPAADDVVESPLTVKGEAVGSWFFEANFPVKLVDSEGNELADTFASTEDDWQTDEMVPFEAVIEFTAGDTATGFLLFGQANPSGLPENEEWVRLPVRFAAPETETTDTTDDTTTDDSQTTETTVTPPTTSGSQTNVTPTTVASTMPVKVFLIKESTTGEASNNCAEVFASTRQVPRTVRVATAALNELVQGPNTNELAQGLMTALPPNVRLSTLIISSGIALADFSPELKEVAGACRVTAIRAQITETLKQFPSVQSVIISVAGESETVLQP